tara:strand:- start:70 stop:504 length:435 start_codon:yes stop_codon:yes gene_type:complete
MSVMKAIKQAWDSSARAVNGHHSYDQLPADSRKKEFVKRLYQVPEGIDNVIMTLWYKVGTVSDEFDSFRKESILEINELNAEIELLKEVNESTRVNLVKELANMKDLQSNIEDLESSLVTARYFIFLGSMFAFLLGLACLFLVV